MLVLGRVCCVQCSKLLAFYGSYLEFIFGQMFVLDFRGTDLG